MEIVKLALVLFLSLATVGFAKDVAAGPASTENNYEIEGSFVEAAPSAEGYHNGYGYNVGGGMMLNQARTLQGRIDMSSLKWKRGYFGNPLVNSSRSITLGGRYYMPTYGQGSKIFFQAGVEVSSSKMETNSGSPLWTTTSTSKTNIGMTPGMGFEIGLGPNLGLIIAGRYHIVSNSYFDLQAGLAVHF